MPTHRMVILALLTLTASTAPAQTRGNRQSGAATLKAEQSAPLRRHTAASRTAADPAAEGWWAAQRELQRVIQHLTAYLREAPAGAYASSARQQLQALQALTATAAEHQQWVALTPRGLASSEWRVASVAQQPELTRVTIEIKCAKADGGECGFPPFDRQPLVLIDGGGAYYPMLASGAMAAGVRQEKNAFGKLEYRLQGGRVLEVRVDFAPLRRGVASVQIQYRDDNAAVPAKLRLPPSPD